MVRSRTYKSICRFRIFALGPALLLMVVSTVLGQPLPTNTLVNDRDADIDYPTSTQLNNARHQSEVSVARSPLTGTLLMVWNDSRHEALWLNGLSNVHSAVGWAYSTDGGVTWTDAGHVPVVWPLTRVITDPLVLASPNGTFYLFALGEISGKREVFCQQITESPAGFVWATPVKVSSVDAGDWSDKPWAAIDPTNPAKLYVVWAEGLAPDEGQPEAPEELKFAYSTNGGASFSDPRPVDGHGQGPNGGYVVVDAGPGPGAGEVYLAWWAGVRVQGLQIRAVHLTKVTVTGSAVMFLQPYLLAPTWDGVSWPQFYIWDDYGYRVRINQHPRIVPNPVNDELYVVYKAQGIIEGVYPLYHNVAFVRARRNANEPELSWDEGFYDEETGLGKPKMVNSWQSRGFPHWDPEIARSDTGLMCIMWNDARRQSSESPHEYDVMYTLSGDGGDSFREEQFMLSPTGAYAPEVFPTPVPKHPTRRDPIWRDPAYNGDYNQIVFGDGCFHFGWGDNRFEYNFLVNVGPPAEWDPTPDMDVIYAKRRAVLLYGDFDEDCDVDLSDYLVFQQCYSGSGNPFPPGCDDADFDCDGDVDLTDFNAFQLNFTGSGSGCGGEGNAAMGDPPSPEAVTQLVAWSRAYVPQRMREDFADNVAAIGARHPDRQYGRLLEEFAAAIR